MYVVRVFIDILANVLPFIACKIVVCIRIRIMRSALSMFQNMKITFKGDNSNHVNHEKIYENNF